MAYKYEIENKKNLVKVRVLIAVYIMFVVSSILIGIATRLQELQNIKPIDPKAGLDGVTAAIGAGSDPTYGVRQLGAIAYCDVVDSAGEPTGEHFPLTAKYDFYRIGRDVGNNGKELSTVCADATSQSCNWKSPAEGYTCRNGQTVAQCQSPVSVCPNDDSSVTGALFFQHVIKITDSQNYLATWPPSDYNVGNIIYDDNEVNVVLNLYAGEVGGDTVTRDGVVYRIIKDSLATVDTSSIFPVFGWECNNGSCSAGGDCTAGDYSYSDSVCTFANGLFTCPSNKYLYYQALVDQGIKEATFYYRRNQKEGQVGNDPSWIRMGMAYDGFVDGSYNSADPNLHTNSDLIEFKGNLAKYKFECQEVTVTTPPPSVTPSILISANKTGPVCVERIAPNNEAPFTITVSNNGDTAAIIEAVKDSMPQGFTYKSNSTVINGIVVPDTFVTTIDSGTSQLITFAPPENEPLWSLDVGETMTITFTSIASTTAVTGPNTNSVVIVIDGEDAIDNITYQFPVEQTCNPETGIFDEPIAIFTVSGILIVFGLYVLYSPNSAKLFTTSGAITKSRKKVNNKSKVKENKKKKFEDRVLKSRSKSH